MQASPPQPQGQRQPPTLDLCFQLPSAPRTVGPGTSLGVSQPLGRVLPASPMSTEWILGYLLGQVLLSTPFFYLAGQVPRSGTQIRAGVRRQGVLLLPGRVGKCAGPRGWSARGLGPPSPRRPAHRLPLQTPCSLAPPNAVPRGHLETEPVWLIKSV